MSGDKPVQPRLKGFGGAFKLLIMYSLDGTRKHVSGECFAVLYAYVPYIK